MTRLARLTQLGLASLALCVAAPSMGAEPLPFGPGEQLTLRITYLHLLGGRATLSVLPAEHRGAPVMQFVAEARSQGFFAWLFRFRVRDRTVAIWDPGPGCSLAIVKQLNEGRAHRDQRVSFDPTTGRAEVFDRKVEQRFFEVGPCALDVLSALFVARRRGFPEDDSMTLPLFDNGKRYELGLRFLGRERLDLPEPLGRDVPTVIIEPLLQAGTGLFVKKGRLKIWFTDDERRVPVRIRTKVAIGSVSADLESYTPPSAEPSAEPSAAPLSAEAPAPDPDSGGPAGASGPGT